MTARVAVIGGGANCEHEVSLASAASVADALDSLTAYEVVRLSIDPEGVWRDREARPIGLAGAIHLLRSCSVAVPVVHGPHGEDGTLAALCDLVGIPYVGSGVTAGAIAMDKWTTKLVAEAIGIRTAGGLLLRPGTDPGPWRGPVVVKPVAAGSSRGVSLVRRREELPAALEAAFALDGRVLAEEVVHGREIDIAVLGTAGGQRFVSPTLEITTDGIFDYDEKYGGDAAFSIPADLSGPDTLALERAAVAVYDALGCRGVARVDFFWTADGPVLNEVNTMPGFTAQSQVPRMFAAAGLPYPALLDLLVADALGLSAPRPADAA